MYIMFKKKKIKSIIVIKPNCFLLFVITIFWIQFDYTNSQISMYYVYNK
jgi:hypothetical protein